MIKKIKNISIAKLKKRSTLGWITALCFLSGMVNTLSIFLYANSISHLTGRALGIFMELSQHHTIGLLKSIELVLFFLIGNAIVGYILAAEKNEYRKNIICGRIIIFIGLALLATYEIFYRQSFFIFFLPLLIGMQNGMLIKYEGIAAKTTHITGTMTDIGVYIGRYLRGDRSEIWKLEFCLMTVFGFLFGGFFAIKLYGLMLEKIFILISFLYIIIGTLFLYSNRDKLKKERELEESEKKD